MGETGAWASQPLLASAMGNVIMPIWTDCPAVTRLVCVGHPVLSLILMVLDQMGLRSLIVMGFVCDCDAIRHLRIWTMFIGPFFKNVLSSGMAFLFTLLEIYMGMIYLPFREKELGSTLFLFWILLMNFLLNCAYLLIMFAASFISMDYFYQNIAGLWPLLVVIITLRCLADPQGSTNFFGVVQIPNIWYPAALVGFFCLLSGLAIRWEFVAALVIGYSYSYARYDRLLPGRLRATRIEQRCRCAGGRCGFLGGAWVALEAEPGDRRYADLSDFGRTGQPAASSDSGRAARSQGSSTFTVFAGSGNRLGDGGPVELQPQGQELSVPLQAQEPQDSELGPPLAPANPSACATAQGTGTAG